MTNTANKPQLIELVDPLGLSIDDWASIAKSATSEAIKSAHTEGLSTVGASPDGKLYRTMPDGTIGDFGICGDE